MATYSVEVTVRHFFTVEVDSEAEAEAMAWDYETLTTDSEVDKIVVDEFEEIEEDEEVED
jgi:hypothetical protein